MTVEEEVIAELDHLGATGWLRSIAIRLAATVDERGTASASGELREIMSALDATSKADHASPDSIEALRARVQSEMGMTSLDDHRTARNRGATAPTAPTTKGRRNANVR